MSDSALAEIFGAGAVPSVNTGARMGLKFTKLDELKSVVETPLSVEQCDARLKAFFGDGLLHSGTEEATPYWAGVIGAGAMDMNPCLLEITRQGSTVNILAHANEGLFKQKTCAKAIAKLEFSLKA